MIGIIGAMESEIHTLISALQNPVSETITGITYHRGVLAGQEVVIARAGIGKVNAALSAQTMILRYTPTLILNTGVAGAVADGLTVMDAVIADAYVEHDMDTTPVGDPAGLVSVGGKNRIEMPTDSEAARLLCEASEGAGLRTFRGVVATGDQFIATSAQRTRIRTLFSAVAAEMEGGAIAHACLAAGVPFASLRVLSDNADGDAGVDYPTFVTHAAAKSAEVVISFVSQHKNQL